MNTIDKAMRRDHGTGPAWLAYAIASLVPIVLTSYLCCYYEQSNRLMGLFLIEWVLVLAVWRVFCPWLGAAGVAMAAVPYLLATCMAAIIVLEKVEYYGAPWTGSDDLLYLNGAMDVADLLRSSHWNLVESWSLFCGEGTGVPWTLAGWPFLLGCVCALVSPEDTYTAYHAIALSMNVAMFAMVPPIMMRLVGNPARQFPWLFLSCILLVTIDPLVYIGHCRKEAMLQLSLMLAFTAGQIISERRSLTWSTLGVLGMLGVVITRLPYAFLILVVTTRSFVRKIPLNIVAKTTIVLVVGMLLVSFYLGLSTGHVDATQQLAGRKHESTSGLAISIYNLPFVGPTLYFAISPVPPLPWKIMGMSLPVATLVRGAGSIVWCFSAFYVLRGMVRSRRWIADNLFSSIVIMFVCLFAAAVITGDDARFKQPTHYYLALLVFLTWFSSRSGRHSISTGNAT